MFDSMLGFIVGFIITIAILVTIHEFGHFWVARRLGVKVLTFSIGFGRAIFKKTAASGTTYQICLVPLGGYVRMVDEREGDVAEADLPYAFNRKPVWARFLIVLAGPLINFLFAILMYWILFIVGTTGLKPVIGEVTPHSLAEQAGLMPHHEIISIAGDETPNWQVVHMSLLKNLGATAPITWEVKQLDATLPTNIEVLLPQKEAYEEVNLVKLLGITPYWPPIPAVIGQLTPDHPAALAGLEPGDRIISTNETQIQNWLDWVKIIRSNPNTLLTLVIERDNQRQTLSVTPKATQTEDNQTIGQIGARPKAYDLPEHFISIERYGVFESLNKALVKTYDVTVLSLKFLGKMITGEVSTKNLGGPIAIAEGAGNSLNAGIAPFVTFLALVSISLGLINLFPIPMLDGGHLLFYAIEMIRGKAVSDKTLFMALKAGFVFLIAIMLFALYNDLSRVLS